MKKSIKILFVLIFSMFFVLESSAQSIGWYCTRNKNHMQPTLDDKLKIVDNYDVFWIDKYHDENNTEKVIYITFDAGYENGNIEKILDILKSENVKASFFVLENLLVKNEELVKRMICEGHSVVNHTAKHKDMSRIVTKEAFSNELKKLENLFLEKYGVSMQKIYRPPEGKFSEENLQWAKELGYKTVMWSFAYADWDNDRQVSPSKAKKLILDNIHNGEVMLLHPTSHTNAIILKDLITTLKNDGYRFSTVEELCNL